jgi:hypothetical protein
MPCVINQFMGTGYAIQKELMRCGLMMGAIMLSGATLASNAVKPAPNGIQLPADYKDWRVISVSHRTDNKTLRVIVGNDIAIKAAREGQINRCY